MKTEKEIQALIEEWITVSLDFIQKGGRGEVGKRIGSSDRKEIVSLVGKRCPTCLTVMTPAAVPKKGV